MGTISAMDAAWKPVNIGAGGWITSIDIAPDGTMVGRTDTYGAYLWNGTAWTQIVTVASMPAGTFYSAGVYELRVSASNSNIFYMEMGDGIYKSVDKGQNWVKTTFPVITDLPNQDNRMNGQKMAIDPTNPNIVYAGTQHDGLWVTRDGGSTWQKISAVPQGTNTGDTGLTGITIQGSTVYVGTAGSGVYASTDNGTTWKAIGGPTDIATAAITASGDYYATGNSDQSLWKFSHGTWTKLISGSVHAVAIDPFDQNHIVVTTPGGSIQDSRDGGATWSGWIWNSSLDATNDVKWLDQSGNYMSSGAIVFDPKVPGQLWQSAGVGVWSTTLPDHSMTWSDSVAWHSHSMGIEQLVANEIIAGAGGDPVFASWDRAFFDVTNPDAYPTTYSGGDFSAGWSIDYASSTPSFMVGISDWFGVENSGFSADGGKTWQKFEGLPTWAKDTVGGSIAAASTTNFIWVAAGNQPPAYTLDGGKTWTNISVPGISDWSKVFPSYYLSRTVITADRVLPNTFYFYDTNSGVYKSSDGGASWTKVFSGQVEDWSYWNAKMEAVPGSAGELFFTSGPQGSDGTVQPGMLPLMHSKDGGATWQQVANVSATTFGYGAAATPGGPATVFVVGTVSGKYGIWYSSDDGNSWTQIGDHPMGSLDGVKLVSGDMDQFGRVYIGFGGSGYAYLDINGSSGTQPAVTAPSNTTPTTQASIVNATDDAHNVTLATGALTNDKTPVLHGILSAALSSDQSLAVYRDGVKIGVAAISGSGWSITDPGASDGSHNYTVRVESTSGLNGVFSPAFNLRVDATAPTQNVSVSSAVDDFGSVTGTLASGATTDDHSPLIRGTVSAALGSDEQLIVYRDGVRLGAATVSGSGWSYADSNVADGQHSYVARVEDAAGNQGAAATAFALQVKSVAPTEVSLIKLAVDDFGSMKGNLLTGATTDDTSPLLKGTLSSSLSTGEQLVIYRDGVRIGAASVTGTDWSFADKGVGKGAHVYTSQVEDSAGQHSVTSAGFYLTISTQKGVKAAVMSSYTVTTAADSTIAGGDTGHVSKLALAASQLFDTSSLIGTTLVSADHLVSTTTISEPVVSLKYSDPLTVTAVTDVDAGSMLHQSVTTAGIDLIGSGHSPIGHHWLAY
ncbi:MULTISPECIES: Ig-like domain-containing protein [Sphingomonas]|uniref:Ig-like domain-containing protein n=1 Tax=Sphingomonas TaxID=13687 RepID=UPI0014453F52|nr:MULTISPECIES: Ig-like domain-containing protein [Sphingomonas]